MDVYTLPELVDLALQTPEVGAVNFNILRVVLLKIISELNLERKTTEWKAVDIEKIVSQYLESGKRSDTDISKRDTESLDRDLSHAEDSEEMTEISSTSTEESTNKSTKESIRKPEEYREKAVIEEKKSDEESPKKSEEEITKSSEEGEKLDEEDSRISKLKVSRNVDVKDTEKTDGEFTKSDIKNEVLFDNESTRKSDEEYERASDEEYARTSDEDSTRISEEESIRKSEEERTRMARVDDLKSDDLSSQISEQEAAKEIEKETVIKLDKGETKTKIPYTAKDTSKVDSINVGTVSTSDIKDSDTKVKDEVVTESKSSDVKHDDTEESGLSEKSTKVASVSIVLWQIKKLTNRIEVIEDELNWMSNAVDELQDYKETVLKRTKSDEDKKMQRKNDTPVIDREEFESAIEDLGEALSRISIKLRKQIDECNTTNERILEDLKRKVSDHDLERTLESINSKFKIIDLSLKNTQKIVKDVMYPQACGITKCLMCGRKSSLPFRYLTKASSEGRSSKSENQSSLRIKDNKDIKYINTTIFPDAKRQTTINIPANSRKRAAVFISDSRDEYFKDI